MNLLRTVLEAGKLRRIETCYRTVTEHLPIGPLFGDRDPEREAEVKNIWAAAPKWECPCDKWPALNTAEQYQNCAGKLFKACQSDKIPAHVVASELQKAVDCRITELLYFGTIFPNSCWDNRKITYGSKLHYARDLLPECLLPKELIRGLQQLRNDAEHAWTEPDSLSLGQYFEAVNMFLHLTGNLRRILSENAMFEFEIKLENKNNIVVQLYRNDGKVLLCWYGDPPDKGIRLSTLDSPDSILLMAKIYADIQGDIDGPRRITGDTLNN